MGAPVTHLLSNLSLSRCLRRAPGGFWRPDEDKISLLRMMPRISVANFNRKQVGQVVCCAPMFTTDDTNAATAAAVMTIHYAIHAIKHDYMTANVGIIVDQPNLSFKCMWISDNGGNKQSFANNFPRNDKLSQAIKLYENVHVKCNNVDWFGMFKGWDESKTRSITLAVCARFWGQKAEKFIWNAWARVMFLQIVIKKKKLTRSTRHYKHAPLPSNINKIFRHISSCKS